MAHILYKSTRGEQENIEASLAIVRGLAGDGGLYVPTEIPKLKDSFDKYSSYTYQELAYEIMKLYLSDFTEEELRACIDKAYDYKFDTREIAPVIKKGDAYFLELFHGATIAFKDMALSILPHLMKTALKKLKIDKEIVILTATSGDTGKAALEGFADVEGTKIIVFYPKDGVSPIQKQQMVTQMGKNTYVIGIEGNFDDAQNGVKAIFNDSDFAKEIERRGYQFSSANSINIGRLLPQIVYYFHSYIQLLNQGEIVQGEKINISVPTGNFGNILAAYYAKEMGLPINKLICASNENKVLVDFFRKGFYDRKREFILTSSPSMDILISSNLERLLYELVYKNPDKVKEYMSQLAEKGDYTLDTDMKKGLEKFYSNYATDEDTRKTIKEVFDDTKYLLDTHTAVGYNVYQQYIKETGDTRKTLIVSTASPYKFTRSVMSALGKGYESYDDFELVEKMYQVSNVNIPKAISSLVDLEVTHTLISSKDKMKEEISKILQD